MASRRLTRHLELVVSLPQARLRRRTAAAPAEGSRQGSTGTPRRTIRVDDVLWGAALARVAAANRRDPAQDLDVSKLVRGWLTEYVAGRLPPSNSV